MKKAFTMLELVFVIVIMGVVASIGAEIIAKLYENYLSTRSINKLQFQTELVLNKIAKRLTHRVKDSAIGQISPSNYVVLPDANSSYPILAWIGKSYESSLGNENTTGWSGFVDLYDGNTTKTQIKTNGSHLGYARDIINALSYNTIDINTPGTTATNAVLIFKGKDDYNISKYGWNGSDTNDANYTYNIEVNTTEILKIKDKNITTAYEQYSLAWTAYALVPEGPDTNDFNLTLKYNFQPWDGEDYSQGRTSVLMEHVSSFKFMQYGETVRIKLCIRDDRTGGDYGFCKEKVVF